MNYKALALDLDGTLTNNEKKVTANTKEIVKKAISYGVKIILASGRPTMGIERVAEKLELNKLGGFIIAYNGGQIIDCKSNEIIYKKVIPNKYYNLICNIGRMQKVQTLTYNSVGVLAESNTDEYVIKEAYNNTIPICKVNKLEENIETEVTKFMMVGNHDKLLKAQLEVQETFRDNIDAFFSEPYFLEVVPKGIEKATALKQTMEYLGLKRDELMACGDGLNDLSMLNYAGFSVAMENACEEVKKEADFITLSNEKDGVAYAISKFILNK
jgi:Cof subfamily protein (haloacid dehalogenase superfamily)